MLSFLCAITLLQHFMLVIHGVTVELERGVVGTVHKEVKEGANSTVLACSFSPSRDSNPEIAGIEWTYNKQKSTLSASQNIVYNGRVIKGPFKESLFSLQKPASLVINHINRKDSGIYTCIVTLPTDQPSKAFGSYNITVVVPPSIPVCRFPANLVINRGSSSEFQCNSAEGIPSPEYTWYKNNVELPEGGGGKDSTPSNASFTYSKQTGTLIFSSAVSSDAGTYYCVASNNYGSEQCQAAKIVIEEQDVVVIIGIAFGVVFGVLLLGILVWWTWKRGFCDRKTKRSERSPHATKRSPHTDTHHNS